MGNPQKSVHTQVRNIFFHYNWPGNIRELQNAIERALIVSQGDVIKPEDLPMQLLKENNDQVAPNTTLANLEKTAIIDALTKNNGDRRKTCESLGISLRTLQSRLKDYGLTTRN